jgi:hypothetical protein
VIIFSFVRILDSSSIKVWEVFAEVGTWMVIIGVAGEGVELALKLIKSKVKKCETWCAKHELMIDALGAFFWMMVVFGLAVEFKGNHNAKSLEDRANAILNNEAGLARKNAGEAIRRASSNELARMEIEKKVEELRKKNDELERKTLPRAQKVVPEAIAHALKGRPKMKVAISYQKDDVDSWELAIRLQQGLQQGGWIAELRPFSSNDVLKYPQVDPKTSPISVLEAGRSDPFSVLIVSQWPLGPNGPDFELTTDSACGALYHAIIDGGGPDLAVQDDWSMPDGLVRIVIGQKY